MIRRSSTNPSSSPSSRASEHDYQTSRRKNDSVTFLAPIAAVIAAAIAVPLLALFYFLKLRRRPVRIGSAMLWMDAVKDLQANVPFRWLKPSILLFLQLLALLLLILAFARPALDAGALPTGRAIFLIDRSASMAAPAGPNDEMTRLEQAGERASDLVDRVVSAISLTGAGSQAMIVSYAANARIVESFTSDRAALKRALEALEPTDQPADLPAALRLVQAQVARAGADEEDATPQVFLLTDGAVRDPAALSRTGLSGATVQFLRVGPPPAAPRDNLGIVALSARRDFDDPDLFRVFARVANAGAVEIETSLSLALDGAPRSSQAVAVPPADDEGPGEQAVTFELRSRQGGVATVAIPRDDDLEADNRAALVLLPPREPRILIVQPEEAESGESVARAALRRALETVAGATPRTMSASVYEQRVASTARLDADLLIFDRVTPSRPPALPSISFGAGLPLPILEARPPSAEPEDDLRVLSWRRAHPLLRNVGLDPLVIARAVTLTINEDAQPGPNDVRATAEALARGPSHPLIVEVERGPNRHIVVAFPLAQSTWPLLPSFVVFIANAVDRLTPLGESAAAQAITTADTTLIRLQPRVATAQVEGPVSFEITAPDAGGVVSIGPLPRVGVYTIRGAVEVDAVLAVNLLDPTETLLTTSDELRIAGRPTTATAAEAAAPREIWRWFVLAAIVLLIPEWILFAWRSRV